MNYFSQLLESYDKLKKRSLNINLDEVRTAQAGERATPYHTLVQTNPEDAAKVDDTLVQVLGTADPNGPISDAGGAPNAPNPDDKETGYGIPPGTVGRVTQTNNAGTPNEATTSFLWFVGVGGASQSDRTIVSKNGDGNSQKFKEYRNALASAYDGAVQNPTTSDKPKTPEEKAEEERNKQNKKTRDELELNAAMDRAGGQLEKNAGVVDDGPDGLTTKFKELVGLADNVASLASDQGVEEYFTESAGKARTFITGGMGQSLERKFSKAEGVTIETVPVLDDKGKDTGEEEALVTTDLLANKDITLMRGAAESVSFLLQAAVAGKSFERCAEMSTFVKKRGKDFVFLGRGQEQQGLVIGSNKFLDYAAEQATKNCGGKPIQQIPRSKYTSKELNDFRGKINEVALTSIHIAAVLERITNKKEKHRILEDHLNYIASKLLEDDMKFKAAMKWAEGISDTATDTESAEIADLLRDLQNRTATPELLNNYLVNLAKLELPILNTLQPDMIIPVGLKTGQGYADDNVYGYFSEDVVKEKAAMFRDACVAEGGTGCDHLDMGYETCSIAEIRKANPKLAAHYIDSYADKGNGGYTITDDTSVYVIGSSLKSYLNFDGYKAGEINTWERRAGIITGAIAKGVHPDMHTQTQSLLGLDALDDNGKPIKGGPTYKGVQAYQEKLNDTVAGLDSIFPSGGDTIVDEDGKPITNPTTAADVISKRLKEKFTFLESQESNLTRLFEDENGQKLPMSEENRQEINERLRRVIITAQYNHDGNEKEGNKLTNKAISARANAAYTIQMLGGAVGGGFTNIKDLTNRSVLALSHQAPLNAATQGLLHDPDNWTIKGVGNTLSIENANDSSQNVRLKTTRNRRSGVAHTGSAVMVSKAMAEAHAFINESVEEEAEEVTASIMYKFIIGQKLLLEQLEKELTVD